MKFQHTPVPPKSGGNMYGHSYGQQRLRHFGVTMIVMGISFIFYYLGLFGKVDGPLNPSRLAEGLSGWGVSKTHIMMIAAGLTLLALSWNWIYNLTGFLLGRRRTCSRTDERGNVCGKPVGKKKTMRVKDGHSTTRYVCALGHRRTDAHFHALKKGTIGHMLWVISAIFTCIVFYAACC